MPKNSLPHILFVITQGGPWGGAQRYVYDLARALSSRATISIAIGEPNGNKILQHNIQKIKGVSLIQLKHLVRSISPIHDLLALRELTHLFADLRPDVIHLNSSKAGVLGSLALHFSGRKKTACVYTAHGWVFLEPILLPIRWFYRMLEKVTARIKDAVIVLSEQEQKTAQTHLGLSKNKLPLIPLGIQAQRTHLERKEARHVLTTLLPKPPATDALWVGTIANLYRTKGIDILLKALEHATFPFVSIIIGEGPERKTLEKDISKRHLETKVFLPGFVENASSLLPAFDLFVLPSRKEGLPYTLLEAMWAEIPVIATRVGGVPSLVMNNKTGLLMNPEQPDELEEALHRASKEKEACQRYRENGKIHVKQFCTLDRMSMETLALYHSLIREKQALEEYSR